MQIATSVSEMTSHQYQGIPAKVIKKQQQQKRPQKAIMIFF